MSLHVLAHLWHIGTPRESVNTKCIFANLFCIERMVGKSATLNDCQYRIAKQYEMVDFKKNSEHKNLAPASIFDAKNV